jgi:hypothetical protein
MGRRGRLEQASKLTEVQALRSIGLSERQTAERLGVARSTLREWSTRAQPGDCPAALAEFLKSPEGVEWLHRQVIAAHFAITLLGGAGVRVVCAFLQLSGLDKFVAASYGTQQALNVALEGAMQDYAREQRVKLAEGMAPRQASVCEDETYHPEICLVAIEPVSNFILLEQYAEDRSAATWTQALEGALQDMPVAVVQGTSDEAKGLLRHMQKDLGAHHSPDLFHVQHELSKATSLSLARQTRQAEEAASQAQAHLDAQRQARSAYEAQPPRGRPPAFQPRIAGAVAGLVEAERHRDQAQAQQAQAREIVCEIGDLYHPYDLRTGQAQPPERVAARFAHCWERLQRLAEQADLPARARQRIEKAQRVTTQLIATIAFFFATVQSRIEALNLAPEIETALYQHLVPAIYLDRVADRSTDAEHRTRLREMSGDLLAPLHQPTHALNRLPPEERARLEQVAAECADLFQRSSSCVEGRNGQLALHHHGRHRLSDRKLAALTAVHNYFIRRADGTTAAERFFGRPPAPLFAHLLERLPSPPRPARKRPRAQNQPYLLPVTA